jgi:uncharacterized protein
MPRFEAQRFRLLISITKTMIQTYDSFLIARQNSRQPPTPTSSTPSITIPHNNRTLEAVFTTPPAPSAAILLFHGIGDRLIYWQSVQTLLAQHNIASLIFHYSGYGKSTGATTPHNLRQDAQAAYATLRSLIPPFAPIHLLGFSLGSGVATDSAPHLTPPPAGLILCQSFNSLRLASAALVHAALSPLMPDIWQTHRTIADVRLPLLIVHGDADELFPSSMALQIEATAKAHSRHSVQLVQPKGFTHSQPYSRPTLDYWQPIIDFVLHTPTSEG